MSPNSGSSPRAALLVRHPQGRKQPSSARANAGYKKERTSKRVLCRDAPLPVHSPNDWRALVTRGSFVSPARRLMRPTPT